MRYLMFIDEPAIWIGALAGVLLPILWLLLRGGKESGADSQEGTPPTAKTPPSDALSRGLARTRQEGFIGRLASLFRGRELDPSMLDEIEEVLFTSDIGVSTSERLLKGLKVAFAEGTMSTADEAWAYLRHEAATILGSASTAPFQGDRGPSPRVVLMVGVNGTGKTTTTGKLASRWQADGKKVLLGAGDTFRAAAVEQLQVWADRVGVDVIKGEEGTDPASVLFDAAKAAQDQGVDILLADTAGRLHTHANLLEELKKIVRVLDKAIPGAPHEVLLVLDGTTGQNAIQQAKIFGEAVQVTGLVLTKLDGTAKGGVVLGICDELGIPIRFIGVGEKVEDLRPFDATEFVEALFGEALESE